METISNPTTLDSTHVALPFGAKPAGSRCPSIDAAAIFAVAHGEMSLHREQEVATDSLPPTEKQPPAESPEGSNEPKQPHRLRFDAADIYQISLAPQPWQAQKIEKAG